MSALLKRNSVFYFRLRIPSDLRKHFPRPELVKSLHTKKFTLAKGLVRAMLGATEELFMKIRLKMLDDAGVQKIISEFMQSTLELRYDAGEEMVLEPESYDDMQDLYADAKKTVLGAVRSRSEVEGLHTLGFMGLGADYLCQSAGYVVEEQAPQYKKLVHQLAIAKRDILTTLQERLETGDSAYDVKMNAIKALAVPSDSLSAVIDSYCSIKENVTGSGRSGKLKEKTDKFIECFRHETGKQDILLSDIDYDLTVRVGRLLVKYPLYRSTRHRGQTLTQALASDRYQAPGTVTVGEELSRL